MDKEYKLLKIQIHADSVHTDYSGSLTYAFAFFLTGLFAILTIYYEHMITFENAIEFGIIIAVFESFFIYDGRRRYNKEIDEIYEDIGALDFDDPSIGDDV